VDCYSDIVKIGEVRKTNQGQVLTCGKEWGLLLSSFAL
jgi:hypothetical protein